MNRFIITSLLILLVGKASAEAVSPPLIQPKNGETLEDSKKHTMEYFGCIKGRAIKYAKTGKVLMLSQRLPLYPASRLSL